jgi:hypothetical protein
LQRSISSAARSALSEAPLSLFCLTGLTISYADDPDGLDVLVFL